MWLLYAQECQALGGELNTGVAVSCCFAEEFEALEWLIKQQGGVFLSTVGLEQDNTRHIWQSAVAMHGEWEFIELLVESGLPLHQWCVTAVIEAFTDPLCKVVPPLTKCPHCTLHHLLGHALAYLDRCNGCMSKAAHWTAGACTKPSWRVTFRSLSSAASEKITKAKRALCRHSVRVCGRSLFIPCGVKQIECPYRAGGSTTRWTGGAGGLFAVRIPSIAATRTPCTGVGRVVVMQPLRPVTSSCLSGYTLTLSAMVERARGSTAVH